MYSFSHVIYTLSGLGRLIIRPFKFWRRVKGMDKLLADFKDRRDNRGIMIRKELEKRQQQMSDIAPEVQKLFEHTKQKMNGHKE